MNGVMGLMFTKKMVMACIIVKDKNEIQKFETGDLMGMNA
jgi:hypothetical protein